MEREPGQEAGSAGISDRAEADPILSILVISYNTREMTLACLRSIIAETQTPYELIVLDNASVDGSAEAIALEFSGIRLIANAENIGFAEGNNVAAREARGEYLLLLNPDTVVLRGALDQLHAFAETYPEAQIWGGRTVFADGSLNASSCWRRMSLWTLAMRSSGLSSLFRGNPVLNAEGYGSWPRDSPREVDIVTGCLFLIKRAFWHRLGGFDPTFVMYGDEADLCWRAQALGARPMITPDAEIIHYVGASQSVRADKMVRVNRAIMTLIRRHFPHWQQPLARGLLMLWPLSRVAALTVLAAMQPRFAAGRDAWREIWRRRDEWRAGYPDRPFQGQGSEMDTEMAGSVPRPKPGITRKDKRRRFFGSMLDPRAWAHGLKLINYYNYAHVRPLRRIRLGSGAAISPNATFSNPEHIAIGARVRIGTRCILWAGHARGRILIGDDVMFGPGVLVTAASYRFNDGHPVTDQAMDEADVVIGDDVWLGAGAIIMPGTRIGAGAIIGAGAVVRGDIPAMAIAVGMPARVVGHRRITPAS